MQVHELWHALTGQRFVAVLDEEGNLRNAQGVIMGRRSNPDSTYTDDGNFQCIARTATKDELAMFGQTSEGDNAQRTNRIPQQSNTRNRTQLPHRRPPQGARANPQFARR